MGRTWILRTDTKGTGAQMVPLESASTPSSTVEPVFVPRKPVRRRKPQAPAPKPAHRFKVVDVMTRQPVVDDGSAREAVAALKGVRSLVDVNVYTWQEDQDRWRLLTFAEQRALRQLRA